MLSQASGQGAVQMLLVKGAPQERAGMGKGESGRVQVSHLDRTLLTAASSDIQNDRDPALWPPGAGGSWAAWKRKAGPWCSPHQVLVGGELGRALRSPPGQPCIAPWEAASRGLHTRALWGAACTQPPQLAPPHHHQWFRVSNIFTTNCSESRQVLPGPAGAPLGRHCPACQISGARR